VLLKGAEELWTRVLHTKTRKKMSMSTFVRNTFNLWAIAEILQAAVLHQCVGGIVGDCLEGAHVWPHRLTGNHQSYRKMYHWQSEHECGTCVMVLRAVWEVLSNTYHDQWTGRGGPTAWPPRSTPDLNPLDFYLWGHLNTLVYAARIDNEALSHCGCLSDYPQLPRHLCTDVAVHDETCRGVH
jgi:hypothetical protein